MHRRDGEDCPDLLGREELGAPLRLVDPEVVLGGSLEVQPEPYGAVDQFGLEGVAEHAPDELDGLAEPLEAPTSSPPACAARPSRLDEGRTPDVACQTG